jgi:hypothetical protein
MSRTTQSPLIFLYWREDQIHLFQKLGGPSLDMEVNVEIFLMTPSVFHSQRYRIHTNHHRASGTFVSNSLDDSRTIHKWFLHEQSERRCKGLRGGAWDWGCRSTFKRFDLELTLPRSLCWKSCGQKRMEDILFQSRADIAKAKRIGEIPIMLFVLFLHSDQSWHQHCHNSSWLSVLVQNGQYCGTCEQFCVCLRWFDDL